MLWIVKMPYLRQRGAREMRLCKYRNDHIKQHVGSWSTTQSCLFRSSFPLLQLSASFHIPVSWGNGCFQQKSTGWDISIHPPCSPLLQLILFPILSTSLSPALTRCEGGRVDLLHVVPTPWPSSLCWKGVRDEVWEITLPDKEELPKSLMLKSLKSYWLSKAMGGPGV